MADALAGRLRAEWRWGAIAVLLGLVVGVAAIGSPVVVAAVSLALLALGLAIAIARWPQIGVVAIVLTLPLDTAGRIISEPIPITLFHVALVATLASWGWRLATRRVTYRPSLLDAGMAALVFAAIWSLPFSLNEKATALAVVRLVFLWAFVALVSSELDTEGRAKQVIAAFLVTAVVMSLLGIAQFAGLKVGTMHAQTFDGEKISRVTGLFSDPNYLAGFLSVGFTAAAAWFVHLRRPRAWVPWALLGTIAVTGVALVATFSRTGWVGALIGLVAVAFTAPPKRRAVLLSVGLVFVLAVALVLAFAAPASVTKRITSIADWRNDTSNATRVYMIQSTSEMIRDYPIYGTGLAAFDKAYPRYRVPGAIGSINRPHEVPLAVWAETGLAGAVAIVLLGIAFFAPFVRRRRRGWSMLESLSFSCLLALVLQSLFQYYLYFEYVWLFAALGVVATRLAKAAEEDS